ncbi:hypothetical protein SAY87_022790 [Trapa incisa]|uniref:RING-type E3 ubiquitin transferase n=1 Tax=Trapa incisa TaxID=236973 RepID=A0AAN7K6W0_9MYRT|nr:hypothetical protein SAY87_022790 [Trapa incisa]
MGAVFCCMQVEEIEDYLNQNNSDYRNYVCLNCFLHGCLNMYYALFQRGYMHAIPSSIQGPASITSTASLDDSFTGMYRSPPRPLPYDADPRRIRGENGSSHSPEESEPLRSNNDLEPYSACGAAFKWNHYSQKSLKGEDIHKSSLKLSMPGKNPELGFMYSTTEEEDVCPTCLEEYTPENPKIITKCSHHFHLGCIYEWKERSESCPVCGKVMLFDESE